MSPINIDVTATVSTAFDAAMARASAIVGSTVADINAKAATLPVAFGAAAQTAADSLAVLSPQIQAQAARVLDLKTALTQLQAGLKETEAIVAEAGDITEVGASLIHNYAQETIAAAVVQNQLTAAVAGYKAILNEAAAAQMSLVEAQAESAASIAATFSGTAVPGTIASEQVTTAPLEEQAAAIAVVTTATEAKTAAIVEAASADTLASEAELRLAAATIENSRAQSILKAELQFASEFAGQGTGATNALALAQRNATLAAEELAAAQAAIGGLAEVSTTKLVSNYNLANLAVGDFTGNIARSERGLVMMAAQSSVLGPILQAAFPVLVIVSFVEILSRAYDWLSKIDERALDTELAWAKIDDTFATFDRHLQNQIDEQKSKIDGYTKGPLAALDDKIRLLTVDLDTFNTHALSAFDSFAKALDKSGSASGWAAFKDFLGGTASSAGVKAMGEQFIATFSQLDTVQEKQSLIASTIAKINDEEKKLNDQRAAEAERAKITGVPADSTRFDEEMNNYARLLGMVEGLNGELAKEGELVNAQRSALTADRDEAGVKEYEREEKEKTRIAKEEFAARQLILRNEGKLPTTPEGRMPDLSAGAIPDLPTDAFDKYAAKAIEDFNKITEAQRKSEDDLDTIVAIGTLKILAEKNKLRDEDIRKAEQASQREQDAMMRVFNPINRAMNGMVQGVLQGTQTISQMFERMAGNIILSVINALAQAGLRWAEHFILVEVLEKSSMARRIILWATGEATKKGGEAAANTASVIGTAGVGAAAAFASVLAALPFPANVAAAPGVAGSEFAQIAAFAPVASAAGGMLVPQDMFAKVHENERILPARYSQGLDRMVGNAADGGTGSGGGDSYAITINAMDSADVSRFVRANSDVLVREVRRIARGR